jgi:hypothetical protein
MACLGTLDFSNIFEKLFFNIKILLKFDIIFFSFVSGVLNCPNKILKSYEYRYLQFFKKLYTQMSPYISNA